MHRDRRSAGCSASSAPSCSRCSWHPSSSSSRGSSCPAIPIRFLLRGRKPSPEAIAEVTAQYGLDLPPWQQYVKWLAGILHGDFGRSLQYRQDVSVVIGERLPVTLGLVVLAGIMIAVVGLTGGIDRGAEPRPVARPGRALGLTVLGAIPSFVGAIVLIAVFAVQLGWFPSFGSGEGFLDTVYHLVLPSIALAVVFVVLVGKVTRSSMVDQLGREHVEVATSRGLARAHRRPPPRAAQRPRPDPHGQRPAGRRPARRELDRRVGLRPRRHRLAARAVRRPARLPRRAGDRAARRDRLRRRQRRRRPPRTLDRPALRAGAGAR